MSVNDVPHTSTIHELYHGMLLDGLERQQEPLRGIAVVDYFYRHGDIAMVDIQDIPYRYLVQEPDTFARGNTALAKAFDLDEDRMRAFDCRNTGVNVWIMDRPPTDDEVLFLAALLLASPERPVVKVLEEIRACAGMGVETIIEMCEVPEPLNTVYDYSDLDLLESLATSEQVNRTLRSFDAVRALINALEAAKHEKAGEGRFLELVHELKRAEAHLMAEIGLVNKLLESGVVVPYDNDDVDAKEHCFMLIIDEEPGSADMFGRPTKYRHVFPSEIKPSEYARLGLALTPRKLKTRPR